MLPQPSRFPWPGLLAAFVLSCLQGCGLSPAQRSAIASFSTATIEVADLAAEEFAQTRADAIALRQRTHLLDSEALDLTDPANDLDGPMDQDQVQRRIAACTALKSYGQLLQTMANSSRTEELEAASSAFLTNIKRIHGVSLSADKSTAIGTLVVSLGGSIIDARRGSVVRKVVLDTYPTVETLVGLLKRDLDAGDLHWAGAIRANDTAIGSTLRRVMEERLIGSDFEDSTGQRKLTEADLALMRAEYAKLKADSQRILADYEKVQPGLLDALAKLEDANKALFYVVQHGDIVTAGEVEKYWGTVTTLIENIKIIRRTKNP